MQKILFISTFLFFISCSFENAEGLVKNRKDDAINKFEQFYACYEIAQNTLPITENKINWEEDDCNVEYGTSNVYQISYDNFKDLSVPFNIPYDGTRRREHADMAKLFEIDLSKHKEEHSFKIDESYSYHQVEFGESCKNSILNFLNTKYLIINRILEYTDPKVIDSKTFEQGNVAGDVLIFDVEKTKLLGGFNFNITNKESIYYEEEYEFYVNLVIDLNTKLQNYIREEFARLTPSVKDPNFLF